MCVCITGFREGGLINSLFHPSFFFLFFLEDWQDLLRMLLLQWLGRGRIFENFSFSPKCESYAHLWWRTRLLLLLLLSGYVRRERWCAYILHPAKH